MGLLHRRRVAIKLLKPELSALLGSERFLREVEIAAALQHPHTLPLFDSGGRWPAVLRDAVRRGRVATAATRTGTAAPGRHEFAPLSGFIAPPGHEWAGGPESGVCPVRPLGDRHIRRGGGGSGL